MIHIHNYDWQSPFDDLKLDFCKIQGHMICATCRPKVVTCPQCRGRYNSGNRLYFAERMLEKVPVLCRFSDDGCDVEMVPGKIAKHEAVCEYREVECDHNNWGCRVTCSRREMELHVSNSTTNQIFVQWGTASWVFFGTMHLSNQLYQEVLRNSHFGFSFSSSSLA